MAHFHCDPRADQIGVMKLKLRIPLPMRRSTAKRWPCWWAVFCVFLSAFTVRAAESASSAAEIRILQLEGTVEIMTAGAQKWILTQTNQVLGPGDRLRTGKNSRVTLRWSDQSIVPFAAFSEIEILEPEKSE